ncbi:cytochrome P450 4C1-like [Diprion similis]|uniref:cytochrome P450 4C1-like n=1 Tax=Diprion similis TaxID=362088 RepID=UPI001EF7EBF6|nr:cytochrome P450 4C1-like [Diprion similis]
MDVVAISACVVVCAVFYAVAKLVNKLAIRDDASKFEGPPSLPLIGSAHLFIGGGEAILRRTREFEKLYCKPYRIFIGSQAYFVTSNPDQIKVILNSSKTIDKPDKFTDFFQPWLGSGLLTSPAPMWRVHRKLIQPTFSSNILKSFLEIFAAKAVILVNRIENHVDGPEFEVQKYFSLCTLDTICGTAMGVDLEAQTKGECRYAEATRSVLRAICARAFQPWLHPNFIFYRTRLGKDHQEKIKFLHSFAENVIQTKKRQILERTSRSGSVDDEYKDCDPTAHREIFLDRLVRLSRSNETLTDRAIREEVDTLILGGSNTMPIAMSFLMLMLASNQNIQHKVYEELYEIYGDEDDGELSITAENLSRMVYLERVIKETLRLFPVFPVIFRKVTEDLNLGERTLPKGSAAVIYIMGAHRSEENWLDPLKFDPDRFLPEKFAEQHPYSFIPFSGGPRNCIGFKYAMLFMKTLAATLLRKYTFTKNKIVPVENVRIKLESELQPAEPITVGIKRRMQKTELTSDTSISP